MLTRLPAQFSMIAGTRRLISAKHKAQISKLANANAIRGSVAGIESQSHAPSGGYNVCRLKMYIFN